MAHPELVTAAKDAINKVFNDTSVPQTTTRESLGELREEIEYKLRMLDDTEDDGQPDIRG